MYQIGFTSAATKEFASLPAYAQSQISQVFDGQFPRDPYSKSLDIKKLHKPLQGYRLRIGEYRILYVLAENYIRVYKIQHRKDVYR